MSTEREALLARVQTLQQQARDAGIALRLPPSEPDSCCGRGCNGCVWEGYFAAMAWWQEQAALLIK